MFKIRIFAKFNFNSRYKSKCMRILGDWGPIPDPAKMLTVVNKYRVQGPEINKYNQM